MAKEVLHINACSPVKLLASLTGITTQSVATQLIQFTVVHKLTK
jgi:hypothetical protein